MCYWVSNYTMLTKSRLLRRSIYHRASLLSYRWGRCRLRVERIWYIPRTGRLRGRTRCLERACLCTDRYIHHTGLLLVDKTGSTSVRGSRYLLQRRISRRFAASRRTSLSQDCNRKHHMGLERRTGHRELLTELGWERAWHLVLHRACSHPRQRFVPKQPLQACIQGK